MKQLSLLIAFFCAMLGISQPLQAAHNGYITLAATAATANSGLFAYLMPKFTKDSGIEVRVIALNTGQAIRIARQGDADLLLIHHRPSEDKFVADGYGTQRYDVMEDDFVLVGPTHDPAKIQSCIDPAKALWNIYKLQSTFASRGDASSTHQRELTLWKDAGITPKELTGTWYRSTGADMQTTLNIARGMNAYALSHRGTWITFKDKGDLTILCEGSKSLRNPFGIIPVSKERFNHVKYDKAMSFINWLRSDKGQKLIAGFRINGVQLFTPSAP